MLGCKLSEAVLEVKWGCVSGSKRCLWEPASMLSTPVIGSGFFKVCLCWCGLVVDLCWRHINERISNIGSGANRIVLIVTTILTISFTEGLKTLNPDFTEN